MRKRITAVFLLAALLYAQPIHADEVSELQERRQDLENAQQQTQQQLNDTIKEKSKAEEEMERVDNELTQATDDLYLANEKLQKTNALLDATEQELSNAKDDRQTQYEVLKKRLRYMYMNGKIGYFDVIFQAKDFSDFINRVEYINRIVKSDRSMVDKLASMESVITQKIDEVDKQKSSIEVLVYEQQQKQTSLQEMLGKKQAVFNQLDNDEQKYQDKLNALEQTEREVEDLIKKAQEAKKTGATGATGAAPNSYASATQNVEPYSGRMAWPVPGRYTLSDTYRARRNPVNGRSEFHSGVDIPAPTGTAIVAAEAGVCIYSGWKSGYGNVVILDHGNGISTLYAHNSKLVAGVGEQVSKGQTIAKCGSTGNSTGPHCHFEVRIDGSTVNPKSYLNF